MPFEDISREHFSNIAAGIELVQLSLFAIYVSPLDFAAGRHIGAGIYEPHVTEVFKRYVKHGMCVFDIGANIGYFTMLAATLSGPTGAVIAIEPNRHNVKLLEASRRINSFEQIQIIQAAAARRLGILALRVDWSNGATGEIAESTEAILASHTVTGLPLDLIAPSNRRVDLIKIDIEGYELNAMTGFQATLERDHPIIVSEFSPVGLSLRSQCSGYDYLQFLVGNGYNISIIENDGNEKAFGSDIEGIVGVCATQRSDHIDILATWRS